MVENNGNLLAVFKDLGSADFLVQLVTAMATVGLTSGLSNGALGALGLDSLVGQTTLTLAQRAQRAAVLIAVRTSVNTAAKVLIRGEKLDKALLASLRSSAAAAIGSELTQEIGEAVHFNNMDTATQLIAHAVVGCGTGALASDDCASGAIGAVAAELAGVAYEALFADQLDNDLAALKAQGVTDPQDQRVLDVLQSYQAMGINLSKLAAAFTAIVANADADVAVQTGGTAAENNFFGLAALFAAAAAALDVADKVLVTIDVANLVALQLACDGRGDPAACAEADELAKSLALDATIEIATGTLPGNKVATDAFRWLAKRASGVNPKVAAKLENYAASFNLPEGYREIGSVGADVIDEDLPVGYRRVTDPDGNIVFAHENGQIYTRIGDIPEVDSVAVFQYPDGSFRTADGKFASQGGFPAPGSKSAQEYTQFLRDNGFDVVGEELTVRGAVGNRRYDAVVRDNKGELWGVEYKSGGANKTNQQDFNDMYINRFGADGVGQISGEIIVGNITIYLP